MIARKVITFSQPDTTNHIVLRTASRCRVLKENQVADLMKSDTSVYVSSGN